ncbi:hypothetical protein [Sinanaerobacter sp. ZZT-01]|uniref:hypothetical protein n=1 Tax=Sinanaerobacter sp. ZZT-01 TaxID=3111540 RepID=UPI002D76656E|nr:hypothetical protein [Sinanaerobacter sp. ZZT-01]WRR93324.1 hypothetical protein U5921_15040 [Sinanaerobacter sp. ZZT-01]
MLGKLIKYDFRSTYREFVSIFLAIILAVTILPLVLSNVNNQIVNMIAGFIIFGIIIAIIVVVASSLFHLFNTNIFSSQGYLTLTLPVTSRDIVISKLIVSSMWIILTGIVSLFALILLGVILNGSSFPEFKIFLDKMMQVPSQNALSIFLFLLIIITSCIKEMAKLFLSCSVAHLKQFNRFRIPAGVLFYFAFSWLESIILNAGVSIIEPLFSNDAVFMEKLRAFSANDDFSYLSGILNTILSGGILYLILIAALFSVSTILLLDKKLDLE